MHDDTVHLHTVRTCALGVLCCFALFVCLTLLASFFRLSFKNMYIRVCTYTVYACIFILLFNELSPTTVPG